jgi:hypothetical protein
MTRPEAQDAARTAGLAVAPFKRWEDSPDVLVIAEQLQAYFDDDDRVEEVETRLPSQDGDLSILLGTLDLSGPAEEVAAGLDRLGDPDRSDREYPATRCYPALGICVWKDSKPDEWRDGPFESVLVRRPLPAPMSADQPA